MKKHIFMAAMTGMLLASGIAAHGYETIAVKDGATLQGVVKFMGSVPADEKVDITKNQEVCGKTQMRGKYVITNQRVKNAVVWIDGIEKGKPLTKNPVNVTVKNCMAEPHVNVGCVGGKFVLRNDDDIMHTVQLKLGLEYQTKVSGRPVKDGATIYNLALPNKGVNIEKPIKEYHRYTKDTGFIQVKSNTDECMGGYIFVFDHPYAAVTDDQGSFSMDNLPPGQYTLTIWHEGFKKQEQHITVSPGEAKHVEIELL